MEQKEASRISFIIQVCSSFVLTAGTQVAKGSTQANPGRSKHMGVFIVIIY